MTEMKFTKGAYRKLISLIKENGYTFADYQNYKDKKNPCILRHYSDKIGQPKKLCKLVT